MRFAAYFVDSVIMSIFIIPFIVVMVVLVINGEVDPDSPAINLFQIFINAFSWLVGWLYHAWMESSSWQATLGKRLVGLRVTDMEGNRISFGRATGRYFGKLLSGFICSIGYIMAAFTEKKQALHDIMASTLVLQGAASPDQWMPPPPPDFAYRQGPLRID